MGFLNRISHTHFCSSNDYLAYHRSGEVDWDAVGGEPTFISYKFYSGGEFEIPTANYEGTYTRVDRPVS